MAKHEEAKVIYAYNQPNRPDHPSQPDQQTEDKFEPAPGVGYIARNLIRQYHGHLVNANIRYLFRRGPWTSKKRETLGQATKVTGVNQFLTGLDFIIMINIEVWNQLSHGERLALVDHELEHCCQEDDKYFIQGHDVEDFLAVIKRNGFWTPDLRRIEAEAVQGKLGLGLELVGDGERWQEQGEDDEDNDGGDGGEIEQDEMEDELDDVVVGS